MLPGLLPSQLSHFLMCHLYTTHITVVLEVTQFQDMAELTTSGQEGVQCTY